jgi:hypothetical protein
MSTPDIASMLFYILPALIVAFGAVFMFRSYFANENAKRQFRMRNANRKDTLPLRLQAYERMTLFMERININKLLLRVPPVSDNKQDYENFLIMNIEQEFEHNLTQQIYLSEECWNVIQAAKNTTIQIIRNTAANQSLSNADSLREALIRDMVEKASPSTAALAFIRNEVTSFL